LAAIAKSAAGPHTRGAQEGTTPMDMTGEYRIPAPRQRVWEGLNDPNILKDCIPGCQEIEKVSDREFTAKVVAKVGPVKATFGGKVTLSDLDPPNSYTIAGEGTGGVAGFAKGSAHVEIAEEDDGTLLKYAAQAHVGGKLAQIGSRLIGATARKMADDFFGRFAEIVPTGGAGGGTPAAGGADNGAPAVGETTPASNGGASAASSTGGDGAASGEVDAGAPATDSSGSAATAAAAQTARDIRLPPAVWVGGLTAVVAMMLYWFAIRGAAR
jgi:carbon monoxide dehydrogenase subunit G